MRSLRLVSVVLLVCILLSGCGTGGIEEKETDTVSVEEVLSEETVTGDLSEGSAAVIPDKEPVPTTAVSETPVMEYDLESPAKDVDTGPAETEQGSSAAETAEPERTAENISNNPEGHYVFQPHLFSRCYLERFGEDTRDAFFAFCDALRNGEDTFPCPDQDTLNWCAGRLSNYFFLVAYPYVAAGVCTGGTATIQYLIPKEEFMEKEEAFEKEIVNILNDCLSDDYNDLEKTLALYEYMTTQYIYDYEMYDHSLEWMDRQGPYRSLTEKKGICGELSALYNYLLLQAGVDSEEISGGMHYYSEGRWESHAWVLVALDGKYYHIDPTFGLTDTLPNLDYFLMTDAVREYRDSLPKDEYSLAGMGDETYTLFDFEALSEAYCGLWGGSYIGMDRTDQEIIYEDEDGAVHGFPYAGY